MFKKLQSWFWSESPVMWVPWIEFILAYGIALPIGTIGLFVFLFGVCAGLAYQEFGAFFWGLGLLFLGSTILFCAEGWSISQRDKEMDKMTK